MKITRQNFRTVLAVCVCAQTAMSLPAAAATMPAKNCIHTRAIATNSSPDASTLLFTMKDGSVWRNTLQNPCPDLKFNGFAWTLQGSDEVCDNELAIKVLRSGQFCQLGRFTQESPPR
jgi:hypothetical protein